MNGIKFLKNVRERDDDIPFIIFTGKGREEVAMEALNLGADRYFQKGGNPKSRFTILANAVVNEVKRRRAEARWRKSEKKFRKLFMAIPDLIFILDKKGAIKDVNDAVCRKSGFDKEEIVGTSIRELPFLTSKSSEIVLKNLERRVAGKELPSYTIEVMTKDKDPLILEVNGELLEQEGEVIGEIVVARDITKQRKMEKIILDATSALISSIGSDELYQVIVDDARKISSAKFVTLSTFNADKGTAKLRAVSGAKTPLMKRVSDALGVKNLFKLELSVGKTPRFKKFSVKKERKPVVLKDFYEFTFGSFNRSVCSSIEKIMGVKEIVAIPLLSNEKLVGILGYLFSSEEKKRNFDSLLIFADFASQAIEKSRMFGQLEE
ncbi:hypothetical protein AKJ45_01185 [candidate division MSBL1 archaeon SCGC-AAA261F19]|uniref:PAS domain-containing protein n=2 Tax=candidate division MSBL1 TaxID=215777 RepID=A0A133VAX3_9EURY|nr:hypothetical protein AKJ43_03715 [candidate division MSBL1 archaeon SCGC-AAA261D19]KXB03557.1 hypothetical protein AKJ45_01185 [candidate division MSBL1 archaeon SCGC-AAA261F19]